MDKLNFRLKVVIVLAVIGISFGIGRFSKPAKVITETKEVVKTVTVVQEAKVKVVYRHIVTTPDGTKTETDSSREDTNISTDTSTSDVKTAKTEVIRDSGLVLSALAIVDLSSIAAPKNYGIHVTKRVLGNINVGVLATTDKKIGLSIGLSF